MSFKYDEKWAPPCEASQVFDQLTFAEAFEKIAKCDQYEYWLALENACSKAMQSAIMRNSLKRVGLFSIVEVRTLYNHVKNQRSRMQARSLQKHRLHEESIYQPTPENQKHRQRDNNGQENSGKKAKRRSRARVF